MIVRFGILLLFLALCFAENTFPKTQGHGRYQHKGGVDDRGTYNFGYDTGTGDAHSMRMEYRDNDGIVRGRYGYTDPKGKLRMVEYEAGPDGYHARGDIGPDEDLHGEVPVKAAPILSPLRAAGWDANSHSVHAKKMGHPVPIVQERIDHPVKGHELARTVHHNEPPHTVKTIKQAVIMEYQPPIKMPHPVVVVKNQPKEHVISLPVKLPEVTDKRHHHLKSKDIHHVPAPIVARTEDHPIKGHQLQRPIAVKTIKHDDHQKHISHQQMPIKHPEIIEKIQEYPLKSIHSPKPAPIIVMDKVEPHTVKEYKHPIPVPHKTPVIENHHQKGDHLIHTPIAKSEAHVVPVAPVIVEKDLTKSIHHTRPIQHIGKVEHHPRKFHHSHAPVPLKEPIIVERVEDHLAKGYQPIKAKHPDSKHHMEKQIYHPVPIRAPPIKLHADEHVSKTSKMGKSIKAAPVILETVEHHPKAIGKSGAVVSKHEPVIVSKLEHHTEGGRHLPAEHRDVDIILDPSIKYQGKSKLSKSVQPLTVHNIDVNPNQIRTAAIKHSHPLEDNRHHHHPTNGITSISSSSSVHQHSADDYHANHSPRNHYDPVHRRPYERYHANHSPSRLHDHSSENYHANHPPSRTHYHSSESYHANHSPPRTHDHSSEVYHRDHPSSEIHRHSSHFHHGNHTHPYPRTEDRPPIVVTSVSVSSDEVVLRRDASEPRVLARSSRQHNDHDHSHVSRPVRYRPWSIYSPGSFYWR